MVEEDLPSVIEIENISYPNPWQLSSFKGEIENRPISNPYVIIYRPLEKIIGYIIYWHIKNEVQISNIAISPDYRQLGVGEGVLRNILLEMRHKRAEFVFLEVRPSNLAARRLYEKLGFTILGLRKGYYRNPSEDAIVMGKSLSQ
ncbi:MAG: ribosomal protein S18-alanine N-acetyltransferase [Candidatus Aminicenantes bacterium]|nr:MAG: ribosomal protein S18-alanine N-acetyltransferase [Candidatus Aminicenantes bacterium]